MAKTRTPLPVLARGIEQPMLRDYDQVFQFFFRSETWDAEGEGEDRKRERDRGMERDLGLGVRVLGIMVKVEDLRARTCGAGAAPVGEGPPLVAERAVLLRLLRVSGFRVAGSGGSRGSRLRAHELWFRTLDSGSGIRVECFGIRDSGFGIRDLRFRDLG